MTVGAVLEKSEEELLALRNFGRKSYDELRDKLISMNFLSGRRTAASFADSTLGDDVRPAPSGAGLTTMTRT